MATKVGRSAKAFAHGDLNRGITEISPEFLRAPRVALRESEIGKKLLGTPGYATNIRGHAILGEDGKPISMSSWEAALKAMGFNPTDYARAKEKTQNIVRQIAWVNDLKQNVAERYRAAKLNNDKDAVKDMMAGVKEVNAKIRSRNLQNLVTPLRVSNVIKSARTKIGKQQRREMRYKREDCKNSYQSRGRGVSFRNLSPSFRNLIAFSRASCLHELRYYVFMEEFTNFSS